MKPSHDLVFEVMEKKRVLKSNLPMEMVEEILLNLPVKSLLRFSSVSKPWNSIIWKSWFVKRYRRRAALPGRERITLQSEIILLFSFEKRLTTYNVSSISSSTLSTTGTGHVVCDFDDCPMVLLASCEELWLVGVHYKNSRETETPFSLCNPSMRRHKKIPYPSAVLPYVRDSFSYLFSFAYGLGYDSVGDDYKILNIPSFDSHHFHRAVLYSLRSDSWREIPNFSRDMEPKVRIPCECLIVSGHGNLHWLPHDSARRVIISFDLSTEKFGEVNYPPNKEEVGAIDVLRGMLCVAVEVDQKWLIWVMEDSSVASSWNIKFTIKYNSDHLDLGLRPLYFYENGAILVRASRRWGAITRLFIHQDEKTGLQELSYGSHVADIAGGILYVDSLVAPAMWSALV